MAPPCSCSPSVRLEAFVSLSTCTFLPARPRSPGPRVRRGMLSRTGNVDLPSRRDTRGNRNEPGTMGAPAAMRVLFLSNEEGLGRSASAYTHRLEMLMGALRRHDIDAEFVSLREQRVR